MTNEEEEFYVPLKKAMLEAMEGAMGPEYIVKIDCPYAGFVEFGTLPASGKASGEKIEDDGDMITPVNKEFRDWAQKKFGYTGKERKKHGDAVYRKIMREGMAPHPFIRNAIHGIEDRFGTADLDVFMNTPEPYKAIALYMAIKMKQGLMYNQNIVTGELYNSIHVAPADSVGHAMSIFEGRTEEEMNNPDIQGRNGKRPNWRKED